MRGAAAFFASWRAFSTLHALRFFLSSLMAFLSDSLSFSLLSLLSYSTFTVTTGVYSSFFLHDGPSFGQLLTGAGAGR